MKEADGYAILITNHDGRVVGVYDIEWNHPALNNSIGETEIKDYIPELKSKNSKVLLPLKYAHSPEGWMNGRWEDPEDIVYVIEEYVLDDNYKEKYKQDIIEAWNDDINWKYAHDMNEDYEKMYGEKVFLQ